MEIFKGARNLRRTVLKYALSILSTDRIISLGRLIDETIALCLMNILCSGDTLERLLTAHVLKRPFPL
jgi:hypothetical protein